MEKIKIVTEKTKKVWDKCSELLKEEFPIISAELGGIFLHIRRNHCIDIINHLCKISAVEIVCNELRETLVIQLRVFLECDVHITPPAEKGIR